MSTTDMQIKKNVKKSFKIFLKMVITLLILAMWLALSVSLCGCATKVDPIQGYEIQWLQEGQEFIAPCDGYFFSSDFTKDVMEMKVRDAE